MRSFFSVELLFPFASSSALHHDLRRLIERAPDNASPAEKWAVHRSAATLMLRDLSCATRGCWEYMDDDGDNRMWSDWLLPMQDRARQPRGDDAGGFFTFTMMIQAQRHSATDRVFREAWQAAQDALWTRGTFAMMLRTLSGISFATVHQDALYLMPRDDNRGFTDDEVATERMQYLRVLG